MVPLVAREEPRVRSSHPFGCVDAGPGAATALGREESL